MTASAGLPRTAPQRPPLSRGRKELIISLAALPVLLAAGVYLGDRISGSDDGGTEPPAGIAAPVATVLASPARPTPSARPSPRSPVPSRSAAARVPFASAAATKPARPTAAPQPTQPPAATQPPPAAPPAAPPVAAPPAVEPPVEPPVAESPAGPAAPPSDLGVVLGPGSTGPEVRAWQEQMVRRTWRIRVDGIFGPESARVARRFQRNKGLRVDGLVGRQTWAAAWQLPVRP